MINIYLKINFTYNIKEILKINKFLKILISTLYQYTTAIKTLLKMILINKNIYFNISTIILNQFSQETFYI
jgi:hypothetical protein